MNAYPLPAFHFSVDFGFGQDRDVRFQEVSGLSTEVALEPLEEGGENRFIHQLPSRTKFSNLVLKRGFVKDTDLINWIRRAVEDLDFQPLDVTVSLLDREHVPLVTWNLVKAYPVKWSISEFKAQESSLALETLEVAYRYFNQV